MVTLLHMAATETGDVSCLLCLQMMLKELCVTFSRSQSYLGSNKQCHELFYHFSEAEEKKRERKSLPARQSQGRSGPVGRFPGLLRHRTIRGGVPEAEGKRLKILLILVEGTERFLGWNFSKFISVSLWLCFPRYCSTRRP